MGVYKMETGGNKQMRVWSVFSLALLVMLASVPVFAENEPSTSKTMFSDTNGHWAQTTIETMAMIKGFVGYPDGTFQPDQALTRAEFLAALVRAANKGMRFRPQDPVRSESKGFEDVEPTHWYDPVVKTALARSWIISTDYGTSLQPNEPITRKEVARILARVFKQLAVDLPDRSVRAFQDVEQSASFRTDIDEASGLGLLTGYPDGTFRPNGTLTRAEASSVLLRTLQLDMPKSPYVAEKFKGAWEPAKTASMFLFAGWELAFSQKDEALNLDELQSIASMEAVNQLGIFLSHVKSVGEVNTNSYGVWLGDFYPMYINNNVALVSWSLSYERKVDGKWVQQKTEPFVITIVRDEQRKWKVTDFPIAFPTNVQTDQARKAPENLIPRISLRYTDPSGSYYGYVKTRVDKEPEHQDAVTVLQKLFQNSVGDIRIQRTMGVPVRESPNLTLISELENKQILMSSDSGSHYMIVSRTGNWLEIIQGDKELLLNRLWAYFNYYGGQYIVLSIDGIPWTALSEDPFWTRIQEMESSQKVKERSSQLSVELESLLNQYK